MIMKAVCNGTPFTVGKISPRTLSARSVGQCLTTELLGLLSNEGHNMFSRGKSVKLKTSLIWSSELTFLLLFLFITITAHIVVLH